MKRGAGFTFVEVILSISLIGATVAVTSVLMGRGLDAYNLVNEQTSALEMGRYALNRMRLEMTGVREINQAQSGRFGFRDQLGINTDFSLAGNTLLRGGDTLAQGVSRLAFTYYRSDGSMTTAPPQVRRIRMEFDVLTGAGIPPLTLRTEVFPRSFLYENFQ